MKRDWKKQIQLSRGRDAIYGVSKRLFVFVKKKEELTTKSTKEYERKSVTRLSLQRFSVSALPSSSTCKSMPNFQFLYPFSLSLSCSILYILVKKSVSRGFISYCRLYFRRNVIENLTTVSQYSHSMNPVNIPQNIRKILFFFILLFSFIPGNASEWWEKPSQLLHPALTVKIGMPAYLDLSDNTDVLEFPSVKAFPAQNGTLIIKLFSREEELFKTEKAVKKAPLTLEIDLNSKSIPFVKGNYRIELNLYSNEEKKSRDVLYFSIIDSKNMVENASKAAYIGDKGTLSYTSDYRGNRIPDFSTVGYKKGKLPLPDVEPVVILKPEEGDDTARIQEAVDEVSRMPANNNGFRGAVLLKEGIYEIKGQVSIQQDGIVIRGEGRGDPETMWLDPTREYTIEELKKALSEEKATIILATGQDRRTLFSVDGGGDLTIHRDTETVIIDRYVPVGSYSFLVENAGQFKAGDQIIVERIGNEKWISEIGMDKIPPRPDGGTIRQWRPFNLQFENTISHVRGNEITVIHPLVNAIESRWGGGKIYKYEDNNRISNVGIENLRAISYWKPNEDGVDDTRHADQFLNLDNVRDAWVKNVTKEHFYSTLGAVEIDSGARSVTVFNCSTLIADRSFYDGPGYDETGRTFHETNVYVGRYGYRIEGTLNLVMECYALNNRHAYAFGARVPGPNAIVHSRAEQSLTWSEPHHRWSVGGLYDNVEDKIALMNRLWYGTGHGWAGANYVAWNTRGVLVCQQPPTAQNWAIGHVGEKWDGPFADYADTGYWESYGTPVFPYSLYYKQLIERWGMKRLWQPGHPLRDSVK